VLLSVSGDRHVTQSGAIIRPRGTRILTLALSLTQTSTDHNPNPNPNPDPNLNISNYPDIMGEDREQGLYRNLTVVFHDFPGQNYFIFQTFQGILYLLI